MRRTRGSTDNRPGRLKGKWGNSSTFARAGQLDQPSLSLFALGILAGDEFMWLTIIYPYPAKLP
jgi:hypothetical protein